MKSLAMLQNNLQILKSRLNWLTIEVTSILKNIKETKHLIYKHQKENNHATTQN